MGNSREQRKLAQFSVIYLLEFRLLIHHLILHIAYIIEPSQIFE